MQEHGGWQRTYISTAYLCFLVVMLLHQSTGDISRQDIIRNEEGKSVMKHLHLTVGQAHMPRIGYGTAAIQDRTKDLVCIAIKAGFRMFDTAQAHEWYREDFLGDALHDCYFSQKGDPSDIMVSK